MSTATVAVDVTFALVPEWLLDAPVSAQAIRLYAVLGTYADTQGRSFPSRKTLAKRMQVKSRDTVDRALKELTDLGAVTVTSRMDEAGDQTSNEYVIRRAGPTQGVAASVRPPRRADAATGGRKDAATVAAQIGHELDPMELDPLEEQLHVAADAATTQNPDDPEADNDQDAPGARDDVTRLCEQLADRIAANGSKRPTITKAWRTAARLLLDRDARTEDQVARAIDWCQADAFWCSNILSMPTLRKQYDRLRLAAQREREQAQTGRGRNDIDWDAALERAAAIDAQNAQQQTARPIGELT